MKSLKDYEYFRTDLGVLYHGDCLEILPLIDKVDLVLTDPPYGMEYHSNYYKDGNPFDKIEGDNKYPTIIKILVSMANKAVFCFCRWDNIYDLPKPKSFIVWHKNNWSAGDLQHEFGRMWEGILFYPCEKHKFNKRKADVIKCDRIASSDLKHPTQKPVGLLNELIRNNSIKNDVILDPYAGSGTTAVACEKLNRKWIGIEISEKYCEIAKQRIKNEADQFKLL